jgi:hypothetical protein
MTRTSFRRILPLRTDKRHDSVPRLNAPENARSYRAVTAFSPAKWYLDTPEQRLNSTATVRKKEVPGSDT